LLRNKDRACFTQQAVLGLSNRWSWGCSTGGHGAVQQVTPGVYAAKQFHNEQNYLAHLYEINGKTNF